MTSLLSGPFRKKSGDDRAAMRRVKHFTRRHFRLGEEDTILVTEIACALPGCAPLETVIAFWTEGDRRHHYKVFKPLNEVTEDDLPPWWMKKALESDAMAGCTCC